MKKFTSLFIVGAICLTSIFGLAVCGLVTPPKTNITPAEEEPTAVEKVYETAKSLGYEGTLEEFLSLCKGTDGIGVVNASIDKNGCLILTLSDGNVKNIGKIKGEDGKNGTDGKNGENGKNGADGVGVEKVEINENGNLVVTLSDGTVKDCGKVVGERGEPGETGPAGRGVDRIRFADNGAIFVIYSDSENEVLIGNIATNAPAQNGGFSLEIDENGYWVINGETTDKLSKGADGVTPTIAIDEDGYWVVNGQKTDVLARGTNGNDGQNGKDGNDGVSPTISISDDGYWVVNGQKTETLARGTNGNDGQNGKDGVSPTVAIDNDGYWVINGQKTDVLARGTNGNDGQDGQNGTNGQNGLSAYQIYLKYYPDYAGSEKDWIDDLVAGRLSGGETYTVTVVCHSGSHAVVVAENDPVDLSGIDLTRPGYSLTGWTCGDEVFDPDTPITRSITINAVYAEAEIETYTEVAFDGGNITLGAMTRKKITISGETLPSLSHLYFLASSGKIVLKIRSVEGNAELFSLTAAINDEYDLDMTDYQLYSAYGGILVDITYRADSGSLIVQPA